MTGNDKTVKADDKKKANPAEAKGLGLAYDQHDFPSMEKWKIHIRNGAFDRGFNEADRNMLRVVHEELCKEEKAKATTDTGSISISDLVKNFSPFGQKDIPEPLHSSIQKKYPVTVDGVSGMLSSLQLYTRRDLEFLGKIAVLTDDGTKGLVPPLNTPDDKFVPPKTYCKK